MSVVTKPIKKAISWVGDAASDVVNWAVDEVLDPVFDAVGEVLEGMADDPITTIVTIAAVATGNAWAIPLIQGASTAAHGGDLGDVALTMAASYVGSNAGSYVGKYVGPEVGAFAGEAAGQIAAQSASSATRAAVTAAMTGQDIGEAAFAGAVSGAVSGTISEVGGTISEAVEADIDYAVDATSEDFLNYQSVNDSVGVELNDLVSGWESLPTVVQDVVRSGASAAITQLATTGEVNSDAVAGIMANAAITSNAVAETLKGTTGVTNEQAAVLTHVVGNVVNAAYRGADPHLAFVSALSSIGQKELGAVLDDITKGGLDRVIDNLTGASTEFEAANKIASEKAGLVDASAERTNTKINEVNSLLEAVNTARDNILPLQKEIDTHNSFATKLNDARSRLENATTQADLFIDLAAESKEMWESERSTWNDPNHDYGSEDAMRKAEASMNRHKANYIKATQEANGFAEQVKFAEQDVLTYGELFKSQEAYSPRVELEREYKEANAVANAAFKKYNTSREELVILQGEHDNVVLDYNNALNTVNKTKEDLFTNEKYLDEGTRSTEKIATESVVKALRPDFDAAQYKTLYNLEEDVDPYRHWLQTGRRNLVNLKEHDNAVTQLIRASLPPNTFTDQRGVKFSFNENITKHENAVIELIRQEIGNNLENALALRADNNRDFVTRTVDNYVNDLPNISIDYTNPVNVGVGGDIVASLPLQKEIKDAATLINKGVYDAKTGVWTTENIVFQERHFDPKHNKDVVKLYNPKTKKVDVVDATAWETYGAGGKLDPANIVDSFEYRSPRSGEGSGASGLPVSPEGIEIRNLPPKPLTFQEMAKINPVLTIDAAGKFKLNEEEYNKLDWFSRQLVDYSTKVKDTIDYLDNPIVKTVISAKYGIDIGNLDRLRKNAGLALGAGGELLQAFNGIVTFFQNSRNNPIDARATSLGKATEAMIGIATATQPADYNNLVQEWRKDFEKAEGFTGTLSALWDGLTAKDSRYREVIFREVLAKEILQEIPLIIASGGTGTAVKWGSKGALALGKTAGAKLSAETTTELAKRIGSRAAWGTNAGLQVLETAGATAQETFAETYDELRKVGYTHEAASARAQEYAITNGVVAATIEGTIGRVLDPSDKLVSSIVGGKRVRYALNNLTKKGAGIVGEGVSEGTEEVASAFYKIQALKEINPDSDLFKPGGKYHDLSGVLTANGVIGAFAGTGTASSITAAGSVYNALSGGDSKPSAPTNPDGSPKTIEIPKLVDTGNAVSNGLANLNPTVNQAVNDARSDDPVVSAAGEAKIKEVFGYADAAAFDGVTIDLTQDPEGAYTYNTAVDILNTAQPGKYTTINEATAAFDTNTAVIPYVPTATDIQSFVGSNPQTTLQTDIDAFIDRNYTDAGEVATYFEQLGYTPTQAEIDQNVGQGLETETASAIAPYIDPRQTTADEVLNYFKDLGYDATDAEAALFAGQGAEDFQTTQLATIDPYVDPRQVTRSEVEQFFKTQGYAPTEEEINRFVTQANDPTLQTTREQELITEFDPLAVTSEEVSQAYKDVGFPDAITPDVERFTGQYAESELTGKVQDYIPIATYNSIAEMLGKSGQEVTEADIDFVTDIIAQQEVLTEPAPLTTEQLQYDVTGDNVIDIADQTMLEQVMTGTVPQTQIAPTSQFAATGIQGQIQAQTQVQNQIQNQMQVQEENRVRRAADQQRQQYLSQLMQTSPVEVKTPDPAEIKYVYDPFGESIFATPQQSQAFVDPYRRSAAKGGMIKDKTDEILQALGDR